MSAHETKKVRNRLGNWVKRMTSLDAQHRYSKSEFFDFNKEMPLRRLINKLKGVCSGKFWKILSEIIRF